MICESLGRSGLSTLRQPCDHDANHRTHDDPGYEAVQVPALEALFLGLYLVRRERVGNQVVVRGVHPREHLVDYFGSFVVCRRSHLSLAIGLKDLAYPRYGV